MSLSHSQAVIITTVQQTNAVVSLGRIHRGGQGQETACQLVREVRSLKTRQMKTSTKADRKPAYREDH